MTKRENINPPTKIEKNHSIGNQKKRADNDHKIASLLECIKELGEVGFTGYIKVNFSQGGIARVEKFEEILKQKINRIEQK